MGQSPSGAQQVDNNNNTDPNNTNSGHGGNGSGSSHITTGAATARAIPVAPVKRAQMGVIPQASPPTNVNGIGAVLEGRELGSTPITLSGVPVGSLQGNGVGITNVTNNTPNNNNNAAGSTAADGFVGSPQPVSLSARVATLLEGHHEGSDTKLSSPHHGDVGAGQRAESPPLLHHQSAIVETVPTTFKWSHGGAAVFLTGSFNNWQGKIPMTRSDDNPKEVKHSPVHVM
jgi:hypothetical protein